MQITSSGSPAEGILLLVILVAAGIALVPLIRRAGAADRKRLAEKQAWAARRGWTYSARDDTVFLGLGARLFDKQCRGRATNVAAGLWQGHQASVADYTYDRGNDDSQRNITVTLLSLELPAPVPQLIVQRQHAEIVIGAKLPEIDFESEQFNRMFTVTCPEEKFAYDVVNPQLMELLLRTRGVMSWCFEGNRAVGWIFGDWRVAGVDAQLTLLASIIGAVPSFVWHDRRVEPRDGEMLS